MPPISLARRNSNVIGGRRRQRNHLPRASKRSDELIELIKRVKKSVNVPVTTGEIWNILA